jgi:hypothetical protein
MMMQEPFVEVVEEALENNGFVVIISMNLEISVRI